MIKKIFKLIFGILLLPIVAFGVWNFFKELAAIPLLSVAQVMFLYGIGSYLSIHIFLWEPDILYVFGHESTHAITSKLFGGKVFDFKVSSKGGSVKTDKQNTAIALTPYMIPFYTIVVCLIYVVAGILKDIKPFVGHFVFALGFSLAFHLVQTAEFLKQKQTDIIKSGYIFSMPLIIVVNLAIIASILSFLFSEFSFKAMMLETFQQTWDLYVKVWQQVFR
jgi:hypothetical protein